LYRFAVPYVVPTLWVANSQIALNSGFSGLDTKRGTGDIVVLLVHVSHALRHSATTLGTAGIESVILPQEFAMAGRTAEQQQECFFCHDAGI
jgi:hypothetical protein